MSSLVTKLIAFIVKVSALAVKIDYNYKGVSYLVIIEQSVIFFNNYFTASKNNLTLTISNRPSSLTINSIT